MSDRPAKISLHDWDERHRTLLARGVRQAAYGGPLSRHLAEGDARLPALRFDNSPAALRLWNFVLSESERLFAAQAAGKTLVAIMRDVGAASVISASMPDTVVFRPDAVWFMPCSTATCVCDALVADSCGIDASFCPVRAMLGAMLSSVHFPTPRLLVCSAGATCDDLAAIAQRLESLGHPVFWWEVPPRRSPDPGEAHTPVPQAGPTPTSQVAFVRGQLGRLVERLEQDLGARLDDSALSLGIAAANRVRRLLGELIAAVSAAVPCPLPALEMALAELVGVYWCADRDEAADVLEELLDEVRRRVKSHQGVLPAGAVRVFWVNPVADPSAMNLLEECGGRLVGSDCLFCQSANLIPQDLPPLEALARVAMADAMVGPAADRARRICRQAVAAGAELVVISRVHSARHCALDAAPVRQILSQSLDVPVVEIATHTDDPTPTTALRHRLESAIASARRRRA